MIDGRAVVVKRSRPGSFMIRFFLPCNYARASQLIIGNCPQHPSLMFRECNLAPFGRPTSSLKCLFDLVLFILSRGAPRERWNHFVGHQIPTEYVTTNTDRDTRIKK